MLRVWLICRLEKYYTSALSVHHTAMKATDDITAYTLFLRVLIVYVVVV